MEGIKENTRNAILDSALELFLKNSIKKTKIKDVADHAKVGEATVYRYFSNKDNLVMQASAKLADGIFKEYFVDYSGKNGYEAMQSFYYSFLRVFKSRAGYYVFVEELDSILAGFSSEVKISYEDSVDNFKEIFDKLYYMGLSDGSINELCDKETFYYSTTHSLMSLCQKLSIRGNLLSKDLMTSKEKEIEQLTNIILSKLKK